MKMKKKLHKIIVIYTLMTLFLGFFLCWLTEKIFQQPIFRFYSFLPILFYLSGIVLFFVLQKYAQASSIKQVNIFLILKLSKIIVWGIVALIYLLAFKVAIKPFVVVFGAYYLFYLIFETFSFYQIEKQYARQKK